MTPSFPFEYRHAGRQHGERTPAALEGSSGPDLNRILAMATAIVLHLVAAMLLLRPPAIEPVEPEQETVLVDPVPIIQPPPPPVPVVAVERTLAQQPSPSARRPDPLPSSEPIDIYTPPLDAIGEAVDRLDPGTIGNGIPDLSPMTGARLAYAIAPAPGYPVKAVREGRSGTVLLQVTVDENGHPVEVTVSRSSGHRDLDQAALREVLKSWRFQPASRGGHPVRAIGLVPVEFRL